MNGVDIKQLFQTLEAIKQDPKLGRFQFRLRNQWKGGGVNESNIRDFYGAGREDDSRDKPFVFTNGEPPILLGNNEGANPVEFLLHALAGSVTTTAVVHAAAREIRIDEITTKLAGDLDVRGLLGLSGAVSPAYEQIRMEVDIKADCSDDELIAYAKAHTPRWRKA